VFELLSSQIPVSNTEPNYFCEIDFTGSDGTKSNQILNPISCKKYFSDSWLGFLSMKLDQNTYLQVLELLHQKVIPNLINPVSLMDFLVDSYNGGFLSLKN
jgi:hypothetical protein